MSGMIWLLLICAGALGVVSAAVRNFAAVIVFIVSGKITREPTVVAGLAAAGGGYLGTMLTKRASPEFVRAFVITSGAVMSLAFSSANFMSISECSF